jgi:hypothetical protein
VAESTLMHHEIRVAGHDWSSKTSDAGETSLKASFMDQPLSIADIDSRKGNLLDGVIGARGWREQRQKRFVKIRVQRKRGCVLHRSSQHKIDYYISSISICKRSDIHGFATWVNSDAFLTSQLLTNGPLRKVHHVNKIDGKTK